jgi:hypothetical protein
VHSTLHKHLQQQQAHKPGAGELVIATQVKYSLPNMHSSAHHSRHQ